MILKLSNSRLAAAFLLVLFVFCKPNSSQLPPSPNTNFKKKNVLWIVIDSLRGDIIGNYGVTPTLDSLSESSYVFKNHLVNAAWTRPSTIVFLTGKYASRSPVNFWDYPTPKHEVISFYQKELYPLPKYLSENGIHTVMVGNNPFLTDKYGLGVDVGFQELYDFSNYQNDTVHITKKTLSVLDDLVSKSKRDTPFFFFLNFNDPHKPYTPPLGYTERIKTDESLNELKRNYLGEVGYIDDQLNLIFSHLKEIGLWEDTTIIITADHGEVMQVEHSISPFTGTNTFFGHGQDLFLENIFVPLIVKLAGQTKGKKIEDRTQSVDFYPFVLDEFQLVPKSNLDGVSLHNTIQQIQKSERLYYGETRSTQGVGLGFDFLLQKSFRFHEIGKFWEGYVGKEIYLYFNVKSDPLQLSPVRFGTFEELSNLSISEDSKNKIRQLYFELRKIEPSIPLYTIRFNKQNTSVKVLEVRISANVGEIRLKSKLMDPKFSINSSARQLIVSIPVEQITKAEGLELTFEVYPDVTFPTFSFFADGTNVTDSAVGIGMFDLSYTACKQDCLNLFDAPFAKPIVSPVNFFQVWQSGGMSKTYTRDDRLETDAMEILKKQGYVQ